ncbi:LptA/OstA family protein [Pseudorhodoplanes sp.]|uniref:LptA/OstA family protein n=1 Tax=Pseudorhodoplanes sp. TaxID=1934341 RepID=UPI002CD5C5CA|nr:LptA/OstA family protein [Pseudorhodoplanes sp.]HWV53236.1 LptA/OstA family protein [Pseudorhodoplanes sp.]
MKMFRVYRGLPMAVAALVLLAGVATAQAQKAQSKPQDTGVPNALQGFGTNKDQPVQIEAASLEVRDKDKMAVFTGNVVVTQGDTVMKCKELRVYYDQDESKDGAKTASTMKAAKPGPGGRQSIRRLEARGGVLVTTKDQTATGATGIFEMKTNTVTLSGGVVISQGNNVLRGERLVVDLTTNFAKVEGGRVQGIFSTNKDDKPGGKDDKSDKDQKPSVRKKPTALPSSSAPVTN